jgi:hypothetical protein
VYHPYIDRQESRSAAKESARHEGSRWRAEEVVVLRLTPRLSPLCIGFSVRQLDRVGLNADPFLLDVAVAATDDSVGDRVDHLPLVEVSRVRPRQVTERWGWWWS